MLGFATRYGSTPSIGGLIAIPSGASITGLIAVAPLLTILLVANMGIIDGPPSPSDGFQQYDKKNYDTSPPSLSPCQAEPSAALFFLPNDIVSNKLFDDPRY
jgi:hypothetical protein